MALTEARDLRALLRFKKQLTPKNLAIVDEFGYVLFSKTGAVPGTSQLAVRNAHTTIPAPIHRTHSRGCGPLGLLEMHARL